VRRLHTHSLQAAVKATDLVRRAVGLPAISLAGPEGHWQMTKAVLQMQPRQRYEPQANAAPIGENELELAVTKPPNTPCTCACTCICTRTCAPPCLGGDRRPHGRACMGWYSPFPRTPMSKPMSISQAAEIGVSLERQPHVLWLVLAYMRAPVPCGWIEVRPANPQPWQLPNMAAAKTLPRPVPPPYALSPPRPEPATPRRQVGSKSQSEYEKMGTELRGMMPAAADATQPKRCGDRSRHARQ
jgi:hypothetical protein